MNSIYVYFILCCVSYVSGQLIDLCSNNVILHERENECLKIAGCCYTIVELKSDSGADDESYKVKNCFKRYKEDVNDMCLDYQQISKEYGNNVISCKCNNENYY